VGLQYLMDLAPRNPTVKLETGFGLFLVLGFASDRSLCSRPGSAAASPVKTAALNHSATHPLG
jgi:hypothetical protein